MKKILLFLFLFTSLTFYSQIPHLKSDCNWLNIYDLTRQHHLLINDLNPNETVITYHLSLSDATNGINPIINPENYNSSEYNQIIYARINNLGSISLNYFNLAFGFSFVDLESLHDQTSIGANDGIASFHVINVASPYSCLLVSNGEMVTAFTTDQSDSIPFYNLASGDYQLTIRDRYNCYKILFFKIAETPLNFTTSFNDKTITVTAAGGFPPYQYFIDNNTTSQSSNIFSGLTPGIHAITVTDSSDRKLTTKIWLGGPLVLNSTTSSNINCYGDTNGSITVNATGGTTPYKYSIDGNNYTENNIFNNLVAGSYITYVKDADDMIVSNISTITQPDAPLSFTTIIKDAGCTNNGSITITATGGQAPYIYSKDGINYEANNVFSDLRADNYTVYTKDSNGCTSIQEVILYALPDLVPFFSVTNVSCNKGNDGSVIFDTDKYSGIYTYKINYGEPKTGNIISGLSAGTYIIEVTNSNASCGTIIQITIKEPVTPLSFTTTTKDVSCPEKGSISVTATGGKAPYSYSIDGINYEANNVFSDLQADNYTIWVKDNNGCISTQLEEIFDLMPPLPMSFSVTNVSCNGGNDGTVTFNFMDTSGRYTYYVNDLILKTGNTISGLSAGEYSVGAKNTNSDCMGFIFPITITEPTPLSATIIVENQKIIINATGGTGSYTYSIHPGTQNYFPEDNIFSNLYPGNNYAITIQDENECRFEINGIVINPPAPLINGQKTLTIDFTLGQTLENIIIEGQNIKWYSNQNLVTGKMNKKSEDSLPLTTVLADGITYYASQIINGVESTERLAVTVNLNKTLSTPDFVLPNFNYYPNPVQHTLSISNTSNIDEIEIFSVSGKSVLTKKINSDHSEIDLSNVASGVYFLKVKSEGQTKTIKIVKK